MWRRKFLPAEFDGADAVSARHLLQRDGSDELVVVHAVPERNANILDGIDEHRELHYFDNFADVDAFGICDRICDRVLAL